MASGSLVPTMVNRKTKLIGTQINDKARFFIKSSKALRSHYCRTQTRRRYMPVGVSIADLYREILKALDPGETPPSLSWFQNYAGTTYNTGTHAPKSNR